MKIIEIIKNSPALSETVKQDAIENIQKLKNDGFEVTDSDCVCGLFTWKETPQGEDYWRAVCQAMENYEI